MRLILTHTNNRTFYTLIQSWGLPERAALALQNAMPKLPPNPTESQVEDAVTTALVQVLQARIGRAQVEVIFSERRDDRRAMTVRSRRDKC